MADQPSPVPADVVWARGVRYHLQAVYACAGLVAALCILGVATVLMAGPLAQDPPITAGILTLLLGGVMAITGAVAAGVGQVRVLKAAGGSGGADALGVVTGILGATRAVFAYLPRFAVAGCLALLVAYAIWMPAGIWGAAVGTFVVVQVALVLVVVRRSLLAEARVTRQG